MTVKDSRSSYNYQFHLGTVRRRRICTCGHTFTTHEIPVDVMTEFEEKMKKRMALALVNTLLA